MVLGLLISSSLGVLAKGRRGSYSTPKYNGTRKSPIFHGVDGYTRKDGTYVRAHTRGSGSNPDPTARQRARSAANRLRGSYKDSPPPDRPVYRRRVVRPIVADMTAAPSRKHAVYFDNGEWLGTPRVAK